jgi:hypothetical protein
MRDDNPFGDDQGTRVGRPDTPKRDNDADDSGQTGTGAGNEAARGIHERNRKGSPQRPGSEPLRDRDSEHEPGYGGEGGSPRTSSDQR